MKVLFLDIDGVVCLHEEGVVNWGDNTADDGFDGLQVGIVQFLAVG